MHNLALKERSLVVISIRVYPLSICGDFSSVLTAITWHVLIECLEESISGIFHKDM